MLTTLTQNSIVRLVKTCLLVTTAFGFWGCSEKIEPEPLTYTRLLTGVESKAWKLTTIQIIDNGNAPQSLSANQVFDNCIADDIYVFYADAEKKFEAKEGATKCRSTDPDVYVEGTWSFVNANATLEFPFPVLSSNSLPFVVKELTEKSLTIEYYFFDIKASYRFIFAAQQAG
jgi:hypothetical protein